jgi:HK97 family phage portal protein
MPPTNVAPSAARLTHALGRLRTRTPNTTRGLQHKASATAPLIAFTNNHQPVWTPRDYAAFAREGFMQNAIVYRSVRMIAEAAASVPLLLYSGANEIEDHPLLDLLRQPNPVSSRVDLLEAWYGYLLVSGNAYLEAVALNADIRELHALRPDRMKVVPGPEGYPEAYDYAVAGQSVHLQGEPVPGVRRVLHMKLFHPADDHYGLSPIEAAATAIDTHNTASRWNKALLDNSARPSGALVYTARDGNLSGEQYERLKRELESGFQGAANSGRPLLLEGGLDWKAMSMSPKDMDFLEAKHTAAREIALALGVPPMLLAIPGDNTFANYQEANRTFWRQTVLPLVARTCEALSSWLSPGYNEPLTLRPDTDSIDALSSEREALWTRLEKASFLTPDEKRAAIGYGPMPTSSLAQKINIHHDSQNGQFTFAPEGPPVQPIADKPEPPLKRLHPDNTF